MENVIGEIEVTGWDENKMQITAVKKVREYDDSEEAQRKLESLEIEIEQSGNNVKIKTHFPKDIGKKKRHGLFGGLKMLTNIFHPFRIVNSLKPLVVSYKIKLPRRTDLDLELGVGEIKVSNLEGEVDAELGVGEVNIEEVNGSIKIEAGIGEINLYNVSGPVDAETGVGEITLSLPPGSAVDLKASTGIGDIDLDFPLEIQGKFLSKEVRGEINGGGPLIKLETGVGEVKVRKL